MGVELSGKLRDDFEKMRDFLTFKPEIHYKLSAFATRRIFPTMESKLYLFIGNLIKQREVERRVEDIFYEKPQELSHYVKLALTELFERNHEKIELVKKG